MLEEEHEGLENDKNDENLYSLGSIAGHNVAIVSLPAGRIGNNPAAAVATQMRATFKGIRFGLMVGIGGGVPSAGVDIRLGDVVVSQPHQTSSGIIQYDLGKLTPSTFERIGSLNAPPQILSVMPAAKLADSETVGERESKDVGEEKWTKVIMNRKRTNRCLNCGWRGHSEAMCWENCGKCTAISSSQ
jgi:nucleoside phosphorylase